MKLAVIGLRMGKTHAETCAAIEDYELTALCDLDEELLRQTAEALSVPKAYTDAQKMLDEVKPEAVVIATPTGLHACMIEQAVAAGVKNIYCEKPIASNLAEVRAIGELCEKEGVRLVIGHQRRVSEVYVTMRRLVEEGKIGRLHRIRATCPGDLLTDGTHLIDSALYLFGDQQPEWVLGQIFRGRKATAEELKANRFLYKGDRYGHLVEEGCMAVIGMPDNARIEVLTGTVQQSEDGYQHFELVGTKGRIVRPSDGANPAAWFEDETGRELIACDANDMGFERAHRLTAKYFAREIDEHPMDFAHALRGYQLMMAIYESAGKNARLTLPCETQDDPLRQMLLDGRLD